MAQHAMVKVNVLVDKNAQPDPEELHSAGLQITELLPRLGVIVGLIDQTSIRTLRRVPGVLAVELVRELELAQQELARKP